MRTKLAALPIVASIAIVLGFCPLLAFAQEEQLDVAFESEADTAFLTAGEVDDIAVAVDDSVGPQVASVVESQAEMNLIQSGDYSPAEAVRLRVMSAVADPLANDQKDALENRLAFGMSNLEESIDISDLAILYGDDTQSAIVEVMSDVVNSNPDLFYISKEMGFTYVPGGAFLTVKPQYSYEPSAIPAMRAQYERQVQEVLSWIPSNASQVQQAKAVHDWLVRNCNYNTNAYNQGYQALTNADAWNAYGALQGYKAICEQVLQKAPENFSMNVVADDFRGTMYSRSGAFLHTGEDIVQPVLDGFEATVTLEDGTVHSSLFFEDRLAEKDKYMYYLDGNHAFESIDTNVHNGKRALILKDSYAHILVPYLAAEYEHIDMIDLRYFRGNASDYLQEDTDVWFIYSLDNFCEDPYLVFLK